MTILPQLESELLGAHARRAARRRWWRRSSPATPGALAIAVGAAAAIAVAAVAVVLLRHGPSGGGGGPAHSAPPVPGPPPPASNAPEPPPLPTPATRAQRQEEQYLFRAQAAVSRACGAARPNPRSQATVSQGSPSPALLSILGVLRRPAQPTDKLPVEVTYHPYRVDPNGSLPPAKGIYVRYIRRARWRFGAGYYIVPAAEVNASERLSPGCAAAQRKALERELPHIPERLRAPTFALEPLFLAQIRYAAEPHEGICLLALNSTGGGDVQCGSTAGDIEQGNTTGSGGPTGVGVVYGVVPDGVATVTLYYRGHYPGHPETARAIGNVWILPNPRQRLPNYGFPDKTIWRSAAGTVIKTISGG